MSCIGKVFADDADDLSEGIEILPVHFSPRQDDWPLGFVQSPGICSECHVSANCIRFVCYEDDYFASLNEGDGCLCFECGKRRGIKIAVKMSSCREIKH